MNLLARKREGGLSPAAAFVLFFALLLLANAAHLADPPYWDAALGVYRQGAWLQRHFLDYAALWKAPPYASGGPRVHPFYLLAAVFAVLGRLLPPAGVFVVLHLAVLAAAALALTAFHRVLKTQTSGPEAAVWIAVAATGPVWAGQTASLYLEIPMTGALALSALALWRGRFRGAALWSLAAYFFKSAALLEAAALAVCGAALLAAAPRASRRDGPSPAWLLLPLPAMLALNALAGVAASPDPLVWSELARNAARLAAQTPYLEPALIAQLGLIALGAAVAGPKALRSLLSRRDDARWLAFLALWVGGFWAAFVLSRKDLVRYTTFVHLPMACLAAALWRGRPRLSLALGLCLVAWNLADLRGEFLRPLPAMIGRSGDRLERSREYLADLAADRDLAALLSARFPGEPLVARWPFPQLLRLPELGFVSAPRPGVIDASRPHLLGETEPLNPPALIGRETLCVFAPTVFEDSPPSLRPRDGDEILWVDRRLPAPLILYRRTWRAADLAGVRAP